MSGEDFIIDDYKLKIDYLRDQFARMWNRFSFFVSIESAALGALLTLLGIPGIADNAIYVAYFGAGIAIIWWIMGSEDRFLVRLYRDHVRDAAEIIKIDILRREVPDYQFVGQVNDKPRLQGSSPIEWRLTPISTTRLAAIIPILVFIIWVAVILFWR